MPKGGRPTPTALRIMRGNPSKRPLPKNEPRVVAALPPCPRWLRADARREWRRAGRQLEQIGLISHVDLATFAAYCTAYGQLVEAERGIAEHGLIQTSPNGMEVKSVWVTLADKARLTIAKLAPEFGMSPSSRTRVAPAQREPDADEFDAAMGNADSDAAAG